VGNIIAGLNDIETVIPGLRSLGKTHRAAGISDDHYKNLFRILSAVIREKVGPTRWDEETSEAWELVYFALAGIMSRPATPLQAEPVTGWHELLVLASLYLVITTPFQIAGFAAKVAWLSLVFSLLDVLAISLFVVDLCSDHIIEALRVKPRDSTSSRASPNDKPKGELRRRFDLKCTVIKVHMLRKVRSIQMDQVSTSAMRKPGSTMSLFMFLILTITALYTYLIIYLRVFLSGHRGQQQIRLLWALLSLNIYCISLSAQDSASDLLLDFTGLPSLVCSALLLCPESSTQFDAWKTISCFYSESTRISALPSASSS
jgi:hypothetical protein